MTQGEQGQGARKDNDMRYISEDRLTVLKEAVRRATNGCAGLRTFTDANSWKDESKYPLKFEVHFASSGDMSNNDVRLFASQLVGLTLIADELTALKFQTNRHEDDPELSTSEDCNKVGSQIQKAIENCECGKVVAFIKAGIYEKEA